MRLKRTCRYFSTLAIILGILHTVYPIRPSALLKRALLRKRLLQNPSSLRPKRQLFREDIPHHRPLTGNTYYLHAGFPHPSRWHEGPQIIPPNPAPITHHHLNEHGGLHDDLHNQHHHDNHNHDHEIPFQHLRDEPHHPHPPNTHPHPPNTHPHVPPHHHQGGGGEGPVAVSVVHSQPPQTVNIHSSIVHANGVIGSGGLLDNSLGHPQPPHPPHDQANFDPLGPPPAPFTPSFNHGIGHIPRKKKPKRPRPHSEPEHFDEPYGPLEDDHYEVPLNHHNHDFPQENLVDPLPPPPPHSIHPHHHHHPEIHPHHPHSPHPPPPPIHHEKQPERKPKTVIHYHPITVGNIINFNDDHKPTNTYGPPDHVPGVPLSHKEVLHAISQPFIKTPYKAVDGPPDFLQNHYEKQPENSYGPPNHIPGPILGSFDLQPMLPSFGPPVKEDIPPYGPALPVLAHLHSPVHGPHHGPPPPPHHIHRHPLPHPPPPKRFRGRRGRHHHHVHHMHHYHSPGPAPADHPIHVVNGHVPDKLVSMHSPDFRSHAYHHHKVFFKR